MAGEPPAPGIPDAKARADVEDNFRKTIGQLLGGAAVLIGAWFAYYQSQLTQQASHDQIKASHDQIISQQVSKGFELLGELGSVVVRLGGIYALEGVMNTSEQYHQPGTAPKPIQARGRLPPTSKRRSR